MRDTFRNLQKHNQLISCRVRTHPGISAVESVGFTILSCHINSVKFEYFQYHLFSV